MIESLACLFSPLNCVEQGIREQFGTRTCMVAGIHTKYCPPKRNADDYDPFELDGRKLLYSPRERL